MTHSITKEQYINDPCGVCSTAFWKNSFFIKPDEVKIIHENELPLLKSNADNITRYFRLKHNMKNIDAGDLSERFYFQTVQIATQITTISEVINQCYENIKVTPEQVYEWTEYSVFDNELWVFIYQEDTESPVALGIADFDKEINEGSLEWIQVIPEKRGLGLGKAIVTELLFRLKRKADFVTVSGLSKDNSNPETMYRKCGFTGDDIWCVVSQ